MNSFRDMNESFPRFDAADQEKMAAAENSAAAYVLKLLGVDASKVRRMKEEETGDSRLTFLWLRNKLHLRGSGSCWHLGFSRIGVGRKTISEMHVASSGKDGRVKDPFFRSKLFDEFCVLREEARDGTCGLIFPSKVVRYYILHDGPQLLDMPGTRLCKTDGRGNTYTLEPLWQIMALWAQEGFSFLEAD